MMVSPTYLINNAKIVSPFETINNAALLIKNGKIQQVFEKPLIDPPGDLKVIDVGGNIVTPGFIDLQLNGGFGYDFTQDASAIWKVGELIPKFGVTGFLPTIITAPPEAVLAAQFVLSSGKPELYIGAVPFGLHVEGPFLNPIKKGAHNPAYLKTPELALVKNWSPGSFVRLVTLAPELPGAREMIAFLNGAGVIVSAGHSNATFEEAALGITAGLRYTTHLFNAMAPLNHRDPGLIAALLNDSSITVGIIPDGVHVHPSLIALVAKMVGARRLNVVTDAMAAMGKSPGKYLLGDYEVNVDETRACLVDDTLAGSIVTQDLALRNLLAFTNFSLGEAVATMTATPARLLNLPDKGEIAAGFDADLVILTPDLHVFATIVGGNMVYQSSECTYNFSDLPVGR